MERFGMIKKLGKLWYPIMNIALGIVIARAIWLMLERGPGSEFLWAVMLHRGPGRDDDVAGLP
jgi:hypothetical protein